MFLSPLVLIIIIISYRIKQKGEEESSQPVSILKTNLWKSTDMSLYCFDSKKVQPWCRSSSLYLQVCLKRCLKHTIYHVLFSPQMPPFSLLFTYWKELF